MSVKFGCTADSASMEKEDVWSLIKPYTRIPDFYKYAPPVNSSSDISSDEEREWAELEKLGPRGTDLIKFAKLNLPPQEWYDEAY